MKKLFPILALVFANGIQAHSQSGNPSNSGPWDMLHLSETAQRILQRQSVRVAAKGANTQERLIGSGSYDSQRKTDSTFFKYSNGRGSKLDNMVDATYNEYYLSTAAATSDPDVHNLNRDQPSLAFDTALIFHYYYTPTEYSVQQISKTYVGNSINQYLRKLEVASTGNSYSYSHDDLTFNTANQLTQALAYRDTAVMPTGNYTLMKETSYLYAGVKIVKDTQTYSMNSPNYSIRYTYDGSGNLINTAAWQYVGGSALQTANHSYTYTANNLLQSEIRQSYSGSGLTNTYMDSLRYTGANTNNSYIANYLWNNTSNTWDLSMVSTLHYNSANNLDTVTGIQWIGTTQMPFGRYTTSYTPGDHVDVRNFSRFSGSSFNINPDMQRKYYYETYTTTAVQPVAVQAQLATLYPIPATTILNIKLKLPSVGNTIVRLYNSAGQLLEETNNIQASSCQLSISKLTAGTYVAEIVNGTAVQRSTFVKD